MVENVIQIQSGMKNCVDVSANIRKNIFVCEKMYIWNLSTCTCENGKYLESIIGDSEITCDEIIEATKTIPTKKNSTETVLTKSTNFHVLLTFLLITMPLLITVTLGKTCPYLE